MKKKNTQSFFVTIYEFNGNKIVRRKKRKGVHAYPRTLPLVCINKILKQSIVKFPKIFFNGINYVYEEFVTSEKDVNVVSNEILMDYVIEYITNLYKINCNTKTTWKNNSEFLKFQIDNLKKVLKEKNIQFDSKEINKLYKELDDTRKLCFIHGDIHKENMIINDGLYLIDWELATFGDLAYEIAMHFILMEYTEDEREVFINKLCRNLEINMKNLKSDIDVYVEFEKYRRNIKRS